MFLIVTAVCPGTTRTSTLLTLLRILFLGRIGGISYVVPIWQNIDILNRDIRVGFNARAHDVCLSFGQ